MISKKIIELFKKISINTVFIEVSSLGIVYLIDHWRKKSKNPNLGIVSSMKDEGLYHCIISNKNSYDNSVHEITTYTNGKNLYQDMLLEIRNASIEICMETYVWRSDKVGYLFKRELYEAAKRGVKVYLIYDGFGSFRSNPFFKFFPFHPNLYVRRFPEIRSGLIRLNLRKTGREHRKLLLVDRKICYLGGYNLGVDFGGAWRDTHVKINGPVIYTLINGFVDFWNRYKRSNHPYLNASKSSSWQSEVEAVFNLPSSLLYPTRGLYLDSIVRAQKTLYITSAYFVPDREFSRELSRAVNRGVKVRVLIPRYSNHPIVDWVARPRYGKLLKAGVEIWLYDIGMIHAKTLVADSYRCIVGTSNIDRLSMRGNYEVNLKVDSLEYGKQLEEIFAKDLESSRQLTYDVWSKRGILAKILEIILLPLDKIV